MKRKNLGVLWAHALFPWIFLDKISNHGILTTQHGILTPPTRLPKASRPNKRHAEKPPSDNAFARKAFDTSETQQLSGTWHQSSRWTTIVYAAAMLCQYGKMEVLNHTSLVSKYVSNKQVVIVVNISQVLPSFPGFKSKDRWVCHVRYFTWAISYNYL